MTNRIPTEAIDLVKKMKLGYLATLHGDGKPCLLHRGALTVLDDHHLIFADIASSSTVEVLKKCAQVVVEVVDPFSQTGFRFSGKAKCEVNNYVLVQVESSTVSNSLIYSAGYAEQKAAKPWATLFNNFWKF